MVSDVSVREPSTPVPEPSTLILFATSLAGLGFMMRRRWTGAKVLASTVGKRQIRCAAPCRSAACRSITGRSSVMHRRRSARSAFLVNVESVENFEESLLISEG